MGKGYTEIVYILDRSGSMEGLEDDTIGGFNFMMEKQKKYGWEFIFVGANIDAYAEAQKFGIRKDRAVNYVCDERGTANVYNGVSKAVCSVMLAREAKDVEACLSDSGWEKEIAEDFKKRGNLG